MNSGQSMDLVCVARKSAEQQVVAMISTLALPEPQKGVWGQYVWFCWPQTQHVGGSDTDNWQWFRLPLERPRLHQPGVLLMDMDSTAIDIECIDEIARAAGVYEQVSEVTEAAMRGELDFTQSLRQRVATLKGTSVDVLDQIAANLPVNPGLVELIADLKQAGWVVALASGGFNRIASSLAEQLGLDHFEANELVVEQGRLTGELEGAIVDAEAKARILRTLGEQYGIAQSQWIALGDGSNDLVMMAAAGLGIGYRAKPTVAAQADCHLSHLDLDAIATLLI
ncbi:MAG: phosphoserine phosphatase SerB [Alcanivorax sp.]|nr:phosphoserine phosphatase SerB [Alcanivorax sp.]